MIPEEVGSLKAYLGLEEKRLNLAFKIPLILKRWLFIDLMIKKRS